MQRRSSALLVFVELSVVAGLHVTQSRNPEHHSPELFDHASGKRTNVVLGMSTYQDGVQAKASFFVQSLRKTGYNGAIVLGVVPWTSDSDHRWMQKYRVTARDVPVISCPTGLCESSDPTMPVALARFRLFKKWLEEGKYNGYVLISDVNDAIFQRDPFSHLHMDLTQSVIEVASEWGWDTPGDGNDVGSTVGRNIFTRRWVADCMGDEAMRHIAERPVLCSGTTLGTWRGMTAYLQMMSSEITNRTSSGCRRFGVDQGFHNFLIHNLQNSQQKASIMADELKVEMPEVGKGTVLTLGVMCTPPPSVSGQTKFDAWGDTESFTAKNRIDHSWGGVLRRDEEGFAKNFDGSRAAVVHQWKVCRKQFWDSGWIKHKMSDS